jgi:pimeloyl-ACP methyl ester carboxylesterase
VLLHGFPEFWFCWRKQIEPLVQAGFRVIVPDQRGYGTSEKPSGISQYAAAMLASDVVGLIHWAGHGKAIVAGHDWGGAAAWLTAILHPDAVERLIILNCAHPRAMMRKIVRNPRQSMKSWYMFGFQVPVLAEWVMRRNHFRVLKRGMKRTSLRDSFSDEDLARYEAAWSEPGALTAMVNWYRAAFRVRSNLGSGRVKVPTTLIWGDQDAFMETSLVQESAAFCDQARVELLPGATHWVNQDRPEEVARLMIQAGR